MNDITKTVLATVAILVVIVSIVAAAAWTMWQGTITGRPRTATFTVWDALEGGVDLGEGPYSWDIGAQDSPYAVRFYLQNDGTIPITVTAMGAGTGCTGSWSDSGIYNIYVGATRTEATLTLAFSGEFSYTFSFALV